MRPKSPLVPLVGLLLAAILGAGLLGGPAAATPITSPSLPGIPAGNMDVTDVREQIRRTGFNHPDYPWVVRARCVRGDTLYFVEFLHRREGGKGFDRVGKAVRVSFTLRRGTLLANVSQVEMQLENGTSIVCDSKRYQVVLPERLRQDGFRPFGEAVAHLSREQRKALGKDYPLSREQKLLLAAFGDDGYDLLQGGITASESGQRVVACNYPNFKGLEYDGAGGYKFRTLAVAQFDRAGKVVARFQGNDITVQGEDTGSLIYGDDSREITLRGPDGREAVFPAVKADP
jgi:hypothetical protein